MQPDVPADLLAELKLQTFDDALGRRIIKTHIWAVREGLRGATAYDLFDGFCQRLVIHGTPLWRAHVAMQTLHPQWHESSPSKPPWAYCSGSIALRSRRQV